jgi:hypothetical protein
MGKNLTPRKKYAIVAECNKYRDPVSGRLPKGALKEISMKFNGICYRAIRNYCSSAKMQENAGILSIDLSSKKKGRVGQKGKFTDAVRDTYVDIIREYAHSWRYLSIRDLCGELAKRNLQFSISTVHSHLKRIKARRKVVKLKPLLTQTQKDNRVKHILDQIDRKTKGGP